METKEMIPKIIHYIWLGGNPLSQLHKDCMSTWDEFASGFQIIKWDEKKFKAEFGNIEFVDEMLKNKKYAFAADYIRCVVLHKYGGIYLDTDMELVRDITPLCKLDAFLGNESTDTPSCGILGSTPGFWLFNELEILVSKARGIQTIPVLLKNVLHNSMIDTNISSEIMTSKGVTIFSEKFFYPYNPYDENGRLQLLYKYITPDCYAIHHWAKTWKLSLKERLLKKIMNYSK